MSRKKPYEGSREGWSLFYYGAKRPRRLGMEGKPLHWALAHSDHCWSPLSALTALGVLLFRTEEDTESREVEQPVSTRSLAAKRRVISRSSWEMQNVLFCWLVGEDLGMFTGSSKRHWKLGGDLLLSLSPHKRSFALRKLSFPHFLVHSLPPLWK